jgi:polyribonucleotide nucleotidyltransferase
MSTLFNSTRLSTQVERHQILLESGRLANQADGSVWVQSGDSVVLVTAVTQHLEREVNFMPLVVDYQEMSYASGRIPGSYFRREIGRPSERETLVSRLIDRPIRPLFPEGFHDEVQLIATVLSAEPDVDPDVLAITGASAALHISKIPFLGPIAGGRVGCINGEFVLNPSQSELESSSINLILAASEDAVVMVEGGAHFASEELVAQAISWGHEQIKPLITLQHDLREKCSEPKLSVTPPEPDQELYTLIRDKAYTEMTEVLAIPEKTKRQTAKKNLKEKICSELCPDKESDAHRLALIPELLKDLEKEIVRSKIKNQTTRIDGRDLESVRELTIETKTLPRAHGSAIFARGETKVLGVATLGSTRDEQRIETLSGESSKRFMLHYNFPPYCVGEVKMMRGPARREIGHGALAERSITPVLPDAEEFPFTMRIVSEVMESNGSSSMATVCAASLALMDAGVPIKAPVAGIAMGLIQEDNDYFILTDILGDEDHLGDMDFKVAGTEEGITAIQMDIKISGIPADILSKALEQAKDARLHILKNMNKVLEKPRSALSKHAPQLKIVEVDPDKIKDVIGPGGKNIKAITQTTGASVDIEDSGKISIFAPDMDSLEETVQMILFYDQKPEIGKDYNGTVKAIKDFGAFVEILPGVEGLVHISQLAEERVNNVNDVLSIGEEIKVKVIEIEKGTGKVRLSRKAVLMEEQGKTFNFPSASGGRPGQGKKSGEASSKGGSRSGGPSKQNKNSR